MMTLTHEGPEFTAVHSQQLLPSWHGCHHPHEHQWAVRLEVVANDNLAEDESIAAHIAFAEFDSWVDEQLVHHYLNDLSDSLTGNCGPWDLGRWIFATWVDRVPHLAAVHVQGPQRRVRSDGAFPAIERYDFTYRPEDDPRYGRYVLHNDAIQVAEVEESWGELWMGPEGARTVETVRNVTVCFADGHHPYVRRYGGNVLSDWAAPDAQLLRVESVSFQYQYTTLPAPAWWSSYTRAQTLDADETGQVIEPRREQSLATMGEGTPEWVKALERAHRPAPDEVPPPPPVTARS
ncbi:6-carboxytetrahydropterin synthase [Streptomyces sp. NPDC047072]|uniref:6-carboxytetrahydropterin synthase n=1 Tax=Streptomyces sp. NPDC047072 TaxID=3154809 RepID=UPI0033E7B33A